MAIQIGTCSPVKGLTAVTPVSMPSLSASPTSFRARAAAIVSAFRQRTPGQKPFDLWSRIAAAPVRQAAIAQAAMKSAQGAAPAWLYCFAWQTPVLVNPRTLASEGLKQGDLVQIVSSWGQVEAPWSMRQSRVCR